MMTKDLSGDLRSNHVKQTIYRCCHAESELLYQKDLSESLACVSLAILLLNPNHSKCRIFESGIAIAGSIPWMIFGIKGCKTWFWSSSGSSRIWVPTWIWWQPQPTKRCGYGVLCCGWGSYFENYSEIWDEGPMEVVQLKSKIMGWEKAAKMYLKSF